MNNHSATTISQLEAKLAAPTSSRERIHILNQLALELCRSDTSRANLLAKESLDLIILRSDTDLISVEDKTYFEIEKAYALLVQGICSLLIPLSESTISLIETAESIFQEFNHEEGLNLAWFNLGSAYFQKSNYPKALELWELSLRYFEHHNDKVRVAAIYSNIGLIHKEFADYSKAMECQTRSLELREAIGDLIGTANSKANLGNIYVLLEDYHAAILVFEESLKIFGELGLSYSQAHLYGNLGDAYLNIGHHDEAALLFKKGFDLCENLNDTTGKAGFLGFMGSLYFKQGFYEIALRYYREQLDLCSKHALPELSISSSLEISVSLIKLGQYHEAELLLNQSLIQSDKLGLRLHHLRALNSLATIYELTNRFELAYFTTKQYHDEKDRIYNQETQRKITNIKIAFETSTLRHKNQELEDAMKEIRRLRELVVMCAWTGQVKMDGKWVRVEEYLHKVFGVSVSHGISEEAAKALREKMKK